MKLPESWRPSPGTLCDADGSRANPAAQKSAPWIVEPLSRQAMRTARAFAKTLSKVRTTFPVAPTKKKIAVMKETSRRTA